MVSVVVDTSALFALLDRRDAHHASAVAFWTDPDDEDLVTHAYVVVESVALIRSRLGPAAVADDFRRACTVYHLPRCRRIPEGFQRARHQAGHALYKC